MQERSYKSGSCVQKNCASLRVHPNSFSPTSVQFKGEINDALPRKRHQMRHLEFCAAHLRTRGSGVRVSPGAPAHSVKYARDLQFDRCLCGHRGVANSARRSRIGCANVRVDERTVGITLATCRWNTLVAISPRDATSCPCSCGPGAKRLDRRYILLPSLQRCALDAQFSNSA